MTFPFIHMGITGLCNGVFGVDGEPREAAFPQPESGVSAAGRVASESRR